MTNTQTTDNMTDAEFEEFMRSLKGYGVEQARIDAMRQTRYGSES